DHGKVPKDLLADLHCAPGWMLLTQRNDRSLYLERKSVRLSVRPAAPVDQPLKPEVLVASEDLVAGGARDAELSTQCGHLLSLEEAGHEAEALVHTFTSLHGIWAPPQMPNV